MLIIKQASCIVLSAKLEKRTKCERTLYWEVLDLQRNGNEQG